MPLPDKKNCINRRMNPPAAGIRLEVGCLNVPSLSVAVGQHVGVKGFMVQDIERTIQPFLRQSTCQ